MRLLHPVAASCSLFFASVLALGAPAARIAVDAARRDPPISRRLFGKFTEHLARNVYLGAWAQVAANPEFAPASRWKGRDGMFYHSRRGASEDQRHLERAVQRGFAPHWFAESDAQARAVPGPHEDQDAMEVKADRPVAIVTAVYLPVWRTRRCELTLTARGEALRQTRPGSITARVATGEGKPLGQAMVAVYPDWRQATVKMDLDATVEVPPGRALRLELHLPPGRFELARALLFPGDHVRGWDKEVVDYLRRASLPLLRFPGGNFASGYHWKDGVGPLEKRPVRTNPAWPGVMEWGHVGSDEWLTLCELVGAEPLICVNAGDGSAGEARQWVEYCNGPATSEMGKLRAANGRAKPWNVRLWEVGNELYGGWQIGHVDAGGYAKRYLEFAAAMKRADPTIDLIANGNDARWNREVVKGAGKAVRSLSAHFLPGSHIPADADTGEVFRDFMAWSARFDQDIASLTRPMVEAGLAPRLAVTELQVFTQHRNLPRNVSQTDALWTANILHAAIRSKGVVELVTHSALVNHGGGLGKQHGIVYPHPVWWVTHLYASQKGTVPVEAKIESPSFEASGKWLGRRGRVPALDAVALLDKAGKQCTLFVINRDDERAVPTEIALAGFDARTRARAITLAGESCLSTNTADAPRSVHPAETTLNVSGGKLTHTFPPASLTRITFEK